jgi:hypothetical protein
VDLLADFPPGLSQFGLGRLETDLDVVYWGDIEVSQPPSIKPSLSLPATPDDCRNPLAVCRASP